MPQPVRILVRAACWLDQWEDKYALVDAADAERVQQFEWRLTRGGYAISNYSRRQNPHQWLMHCLILQSRGIDHVNGNPLDNRRSNLRPVTDSQNQANRRRWKGGTSPYKGVSWNPQTGRWRARIKYDYVEKFLGHFGTEVEAAAAYDRKALELFGEFACINGVLTPMEV